MDEKDLRVRFGDGLFEEGRRIADAGGVVLLSSAGGVEVYRVDDGEGSHATVVRRVFGDGREDRYDCGCPDIPCIHCAAVEARLCLYGSAGLDDPEVIKGFEDEIGRFEETVLADPRFNKGTACFDEMDKARYHITDRNEEAERDLTTDLCSRILGGVRDPHEALRLLDLLQTTMNESDYRNDGLDSAYLRLRDRIAPVFREADPEDIAEVISHGSAYNWAENFLQHAPKEVVEEAYRIARDSGWYGGIISEMMLDHGDYGLYVDTAIDKDGAALEAAEDLIGKGGAGSDAAATVRGLMARIDPHRHTKDCEGDASRLADAFDALRMREQALVVYEDLYRRYPSDEYYQGIARNSSEEHAHELQDEMVRRTEDLDHLDFMTLACLASEGRPEAADIVRRIGFTYERDEDPWGRHLYLTGAVDLVKALAAGGWHEEAAIVARGLVGTRLDGDDPHMYDDAVEALKAMDADPGFEGLEEPHSAYKARMRNEYEAKGRFWRMYDGTWTDEDDRGPWGYRSRRYAISVLPDADLWTRRISACGSGTTCSTKGRPSPMPEP